MSELEGINEVGYRKPPKHTQFQKGKFGNPKGRPKGAKSLATILDKVGRQPITITEKGRTRTITKKEAALLQLANKSTSGDLRAIDHFMRLTVLVENSQEVSELPGPDERDRTVMENMLKRIRETELENSDDRETNPDSEEEE